MTAWELYCEIERRMGHPSPDRSTFTGVRRESLERVVGIINEEAQRLAGAGALARSTQAQAKVDAATRTALLASEEFVRFVAGLPVQDLPLKDQRELREKVYALRRDLKAVNKNVTITIIPIEKKG